MKIFFLNAVFWVTVFSFIKFFLNLKLASLLLPSDYGIILVPIIFFGFLDLLFEGGFHSGIIKFNASKNDIRLIFKQKLKLAIMVIPPAGLILSILTTQFFTSSLPNAVILIFMLTALIKLTNYFTEAKLIAEGYYLRTELYSFITTVMTYSLFIFFIPKISMPGFYSLALINLVIISSYGFCLNLLLSHINLPKQESQLKDLNNFASSVIQSTFLFAIGARIDEITASLLISSNTLGLYSKLKELGITIGTFSSKIISRPWYYIACNIKATSVQQIYFACLVGSMFVAFFLLNFLITLVSFLITFLGPNWTQLSDFSIFIVLIFIMYFYVVFTNVTMLSLGLEREQLFIDRWMIGIKISLYLAMTAMIGANYVEFEIKTFLLIEIASRILNLLLQIICLARKSGSNNIFDMRT